MKTKTKPAKKVPAKALPSYKTKSALKASKKSVEKTR